MRTWPWREASFRRQRYFCKVLKSAYPSLKSAVEPPQPKPAGLVEFLLHPSQLQPQVLHNKAHHKP